MVGVLAPDDGTLDAATLIAARSPVVSTGAIEIVELLCRQKIDEVIFVLQECASPDVLNLTALCHGRGIKVSLVPQLYELYRSRSELVDLGGLPVLQLARSGLSLSTRIWKRAFDLLLGAPLALTAIPFLLPLALILRLTKGQAFRWEKRCGWQGKSFPMLRLNIDCASASQGNRSRMDEILHALSLVDLPQLWNVLRGEMTLVGPRPECPERVCRYSEWQRQRLTVKPGMTGLAQVEGLREQHSSEEKTRFDLQYLLHISPWTDLSLLLQTIWTVATRLALCEKFPVKAANTHPAAETPDFPAGEPADHNADEQADQHANQPAYAPIRPLIAQEILENAHRS